MFLEQSFRGNNKFSNYLLGTINILIFSQVIGALPLIIVSFIKGANILELSNSIDQNFLLVLQLFPFITGCFALWFTVIKIHKKRFQDIITSRKSFDFKRALTGGAIWGIILILSMLPEFFGSNPTLELNFQPDKFIWLILICLVLLPFQTSFEELLFRGYYMQGTAVTSKNRWVPIIVTSVIFGLLHSANPEVAAFGFWTAMPSYVVTGLILGIAVVMDDGLEISLGMHFANNFISAVFFTSKDSALQTPALFVDTDPSMTYMDNIIIVVAGIVFLAACYKIFKWESFMKIFTRIKVKPQIQDI